MTDFLLELRSEEIPARMQARAREDLARLFAAELGAQGIPLLKLTTFATPRRLALIARDLPEQTVEASDEIKGPRTSAPPQALEGFLRKTGLTQDQLEDRDGVWFAVVNKPGRKTVDVLAEAIPAIVRAFPWPKSMRWGDASLSTESLRWVRPLQGIVALLGDEVVPLEIAGIASGSATLGHRFHHPGAITIGSAADYVEKLRACHVIVDQDERARVIRDAAATLAADAGLALIEDEGLVAENAGLTEWPVPLLGRFDEAFLEVPPEVIQLTARVNQKYFVCREPVPLPRAGGARGGPVTEGQEDKPSREREGRLANAFICVANIDAADGGDRIVEGNRKVLAARLADAKFFYETDLKTRLEDQLPKLEKIVFHEKLGTLADKVQRVAKLARWLVEEGIVGAGQTRTPFASSEVEKRDRDATGERVSTSLDTNGDRAILADMAERAARLAKADLVTGMVGEFPELQGLMGGYYAAAQGEDPRVAAAIRDHYKPVGQGDEVPTEPVTVAVSLADKLDTLVSFFIGAEQPTGSKDPYALRRSALGFIATVLDNQLRLSIRSAIFAAYWEFRKTVINRLHRDKFLEFLMGSKGLPSEPRAEIVRHIEQSRETRLAEADETELKAIFWNVKALENFFADRLKVQQREAGVRHDLIDAVFALGGEDDLVRLLARVKALQAFITTEDGANLLTGYRRAANILKKEEWVEPEPDVMAGPEDQHIPQTGEEDPLVLVDDPDLAAAVAAHIADSRRAGAIALSYTPEKEEAALIAALDSAAPAAAGAVDREDFEAAMTALASLRAPIDAFFEHVTVNDADPDKRAARLALLARVRDAVHGVADFSKIEG